MTCHVVKSNFKRLWITLIKSSLNGSKFHNTMLPWIFFSVCPGRRIGFFLHGNSDPDSFVHEKIRDRHDFGWREQSLRSYHLLALSTKEEASIHVSYQVIWDAMMSGSLFMINSSDDNDDLFLQTLNSVNARLPVNPISRFQIRLFHSPPSTPRDSLCCSPPMDGNLDTLTIISCS